MSYQRPDQLRKVAILVASLDETLAQMLLAELPPSQALKVMDLAERLGEIDPEEQADVLEDFRKSSAMATEGSSPLAGSSRAVEVEASLQAQIAQLEREDPTVTESEPTYASYPQREAPLAGQVGGVPTLQETDEQHQRLLADAAGPALAELLVAEQAQTIALVLSRLSEAQAAQTLAHLPQTLQVHVVERLIQSQPPAQEVVAELQSQIAGSIAEKKQQQDYFEAGSSLARRILDCAPYEVRSGVISRLQTSNQRIATALTATQAIAQPPVESVRTTSVGRAYQAAATEDNLKAQAEELQATPPVNRVAELTPATPPPVPTYEPTLLETLDTRTLSALFGAVGPQKTQLVLAAASEALLSRVLKQLPRRDAKKLRSKIRDFQPTKLSDLCDAQQQVLQLADRGGFLKQAA